MSRQVCDIASNVNVLWARMDAAARIKTKEIEEKRECLLVTAYVPIKTRTQFDAFKEKLKSDADFINLFVRLTFFADVLVSPCM